MANAVPSKSITVPSMTFTFSVILNLHTAVAGCSMRILCEGHCLEPPENCDAMFYISGAEVVQTGAKILTFEKQRRRNAAEYAACRMTALKSPDLARDLAQAVMECKSEEPGRRLGAIRGNVCVGASGLFRFCKFREFLLAERHKPTADDADCARPKQIYRSCQ